MQIVRITNIQDILYNDESDLTNTFIYVHNIDDALVAAEESSAELIIVDTHISPLQQLLAGIKLLPQYLRLILLRPDLPYYIVADNNCNAFFHYECKGKYENEVADAHL